ncbi:MAG: ATP-dependent helicase [Candidatus Sericytochromatia bacterium]|nr:ATP-dependent helicase [Candidatus Sericytochromatia bacterium]
MSQLFLHDTLLDGLNPAQLQAVTTLNGPVLVIAAPGSGKTSVLTRRIARMVRQGIAPEAILAVTFTRKAAGEMAERVSLLLGDKDSQTKLTIATFNSLGMKLIQQHHAALGFARPPRLLVEQGQRMVIDLVRRELKADVSAQDVAAFISWNKSRLVAPDQVRSVSADPKDAVLAKAYAKYDDWLKTRCTYDFDDQIVLPVRLLEKHPEIRASVNATWTHLLIDEFQDTNKAQYRLARLLAGEAMNLFAVGDDAQGIYGFRAAELDNLLGFDRDFPGTIRIMMEQNYRSTPQILDLANQLIRHNSKQIEKTIRAVKPPGEPWEQCICPDSFQEADWIVGRIQALAAKGHPLDEIAVLYRTHAQAGLLIEQLDQAKIPYSAKRSGSFLEHPGLQELLGYLRLVPPSSSMAELGLEALLKRRGAMAETVSALSGTARMRKKALLDVCRDARNCPLPTLAQQQTVLQTVAMIDGWRRFKGPVDALILQVLKDTGLRGQLENSRKEEARQKLDVLSTFHAIAQRWACRTVGELLRRVDDSLKPRKPKGRQKAVQLVTIHAAKGLEWETVFLMGLEEETLPYQLAIEEGGIAEERRLCYVAVTRAKSRLLLSYSNQRIRFGHRRDAMPSRFLREMGAGTTAPEVRQG